MATLQNIIDTIPCTLDKLIIDFAISNLVETGTGLGDSIEYAAKFSFKRIVSTEINERIAVRASRRFQNNEKVTILLGHSVDILKEITLEGNCLFFLDAHFPGVDFKLSKLEDTKENNIRTPLEEELRTITQKRPQTIFKDVFIVDDLRIYEDGHFAAGNWDKRSEFGGSDSKFIFDLLKETHAIEKYYEFQGFIVGVPK